MEFLTAFAFGFVVMLIFMAILKLPYIGAFIKMFIVAAAMVMFLDHSGKNRKDHDSMI